MNNNQTRFLDQPRPHIQAGILQGRTDTTTLAAHDFDVDVRSGFMPPDSPLARLPSNWETWEELLDEPSRRPFPLGDSLINLAHDSGDRSDCWRARVRQVNFQSDLRI
jgi:indoleamine 2,3-dioxygenase